MSGNSRQDDAPTAGNALAALLVDPLRAKSVAPEAIPALLCQLSALQSVLASRLLDTEAGARRSDPSEADSLLDVSEAAKRLSTSPDWLYRHARRLPFAVRLGPRQLRFSARGIEKFIQQRKRR